MTQLQSTTADNAQWLQSLVKKQERVVELSSMLANSVDTPATSVTSKHPVSIGDGQASKSIRENAAQNVSAFHLLFGAIWHGLAKMGASIANALEPFITARSARKEQLAIYATPDGQALIKVLMSDPDNRNSIRLARENSTQARSDKQNNSLLIGMRLSDELAAQKDSGAGSLLVNDLESGKQYPVNPTLTMARHLVNYLTDVADKQVQPGAFEVVAQEDGSFIVNDPDRKIYGFLSYVPTAYTATMAASKHTGTQFTPGTAALTIDDPNRAFPGNTSSIQFNMELNADGEQVLRVRLSNDKHQPVFVPLQNESTTGRAVLQSIPNVERLFSRQTDFSQLSTEELDARKTQLYAEVQSLDTLIEGDFKQIGILKDRQNPDYLPREAAGDAS